MSSASGERSSTRADRGLEPGSRIVLYLANPSEKYWGVLYDLSAPGVTLRGLSLASFEEWMQSITREEEQMIALSTMFFPLLRVERILLDEPVGAADSLSQRFERLVGRSVDAYLGG